MSTESMNGGAAQSSIRLGFLTDLHWASRTAGGHGWHNAYDFAGLEHRLAAAADWFDVAGVSVVLVGGDVAHRGDRASIAAPLGVLRQATRAVVVAVAGNHDVAIRADQLERAASDPVAKSEGERDLRVELAGPGGFRVDSIHVAGVHVGQAGGWLAVATELADGPEPAAWGANPVVLVSHYPLVSRAASIAAHGFAYPADLLGRQQILELLTERRGPTIVLSGHIHARDSATVGSVLQLVQGALIEPPFECGVIEILCAEGRLSVRRESRPLQASGDVRLPVFAADREAWSYVDDSWLAGDRGWPLVGAELPTT